jgi:SAM-dependent MidA family methyltransferase
MTWQTWREAMSNALYGEDGFYRQPAGPAAHFRTSVHASAGFALAVMRLAVAVSQQAGSRDFAIVDVGAGRGELLRQLSSSITPWRLIGVDVVDRPVDLPERVEWRRGLAELESIPYGLLIANEWLDNIPLDVVEDGRLVEVDVNGGERAGGALSRRDLDWHRSWAFDTRDRMELGWTRDDAWVEAVSHLKVGAAVAIDYQLRPELQRSGTLTGYRDGRQVPPVPDGSCDLTAHVLLESCAEAAGGPALLLDQRTALSALGVSVALPPRELASSNPAAYLQGLAAAGSTTELMDPQGLGGFGWLVQPRGLEVPDVFGLRTRSLG